ncbi:hypothetical protein [Enterococcus sp. AZ103]|uniref:hypothetical protein n=1 Tax=Enterococcus sp. AZ103 TaxID=2774628 RepID=UPI003F243148
MNSIARKVATIFCLMTIVAAFYVHPILSLNATITDQPGANYASNWYLSRFSGLHWINKYVGMKQADGVPACCIEHGVNIGSGGGFAPSELTIAEKDKISLISYYGYQVNPNLDTYTLA